MDVREHRVVAERVSRAAAWRANGTLPVGGPFLDATGGGMMIASDDVTEAALDAVAAADPAVASGLLS